MPYTLWLKAGADGSRMAGDPSAHHIFMTLLLKSEADPTLKFDVRTINEARPPAEFKETGLRHTPALQIAEDEGICQLDDILLEVDKFGPKFPTNEAAEDATADIFRQFAFFIKDVNKDSKALLGEFKRINDHLETEGTSFLAGDKPTYLDCLLLPRIHSIRVAAQSLKDLEIPEDLTFLWKYLRAGYELECFKTSCPCDQEILLHWVKKPGVTLAASKKSKLAREKATYSFTTPV